MYMHTITNLVYFFTDFTVSNGLPTGPKRVVGLLGMQSRGEIVLDGDIGAEIQKKRLRALEGGFMRT